MNAAEKIRNRLPAWTSMRFDPKSAGWQFIDVIAENIDGFTQTLDRLKEQRYLKTVDLKQPWICYAGRLPHYCFKNKATVAIEAVGRRLRQVNSLEMFLFVEDPDLETLRQYHEDLAYIDKETGNVYVHKPYDKDDMYPYGRIRAAMVNQGGEVVNRFTIPLHPVPLWTSLDELGLLLGVHRLPDEDNRSFLLRIYAASRLPANSSLSGWIRGIARELGLFMTATWRNGGRDFLIPHKNVNRETIMVDLEPVADKDILVGPNGQLAIKGNFRYSGKQRSVSYAYGIRIHELFNFDDDWVKSALFDESGFFTAEAIRLKEELDRLAPVKWDYFIWGDALWDSGSSGILPDMYDARVDGFVAL